jgi:hypothetical protein
MGTNSTGCTEWERDYDAVTEQPLTKHQDWITGTPNQLRKALVPRGLVVDDKGTPITKGKLMNSLLWLQPSRACIWRISHLDDRRVVVVRNERTDR